MKCFSHFVVFHKNPHCGEFLSKVLAKEKTQEVSRNQAEAIEAGVAVQEFNKKRDLSSWVIAKAEATLWLKRKDEIASLSPYLRVLDQEWVLK